MLFGVLFQKDFLHICPERSILVRNWCSFLKTDLNNQYIRKFIFINETNSEKLQDQNE